MSKNRAKNTSPELLLRNYLWGSGIKGYRLHRKDFPGSPDIAFVSRKVAIFVNGCFWHRCPSCNLPLPKSNREFWRKKFISNISRDKRKRHELTELGWQVLTIWECQIKNDIEACIVRIQKVLEFDLD